jgi:1-aminocyclopropane-1-carboxylate deaminase
MEYSPWSESPMCVVKRVDLIHPIISGNKWFKLKYNLEQAKMGEYDTLLSFGGQWSNHIHALAYAAKENGLKSIGIIRGEQLEPKSQMLIDAESYGMRLEFVTREAYKEKNTEDFKMWLLEQYGPCFIIPEGGANFLGINGCMEMLKAADEEYNVICCSAGTGAMAAGLLLSLKKHQKLHVFPALKGGFMKEEMQTHLEYFLMDRDAAKDLLNSVVFHDDYHFGGYAKTTIELLHFIEKTRSEKNIPLDQVYTGKLMYGVNDLLQCHYFEKSDKILVIHSGGLQGYRSVAEV